MAPRALQTNPQEDLSCIGGYGMQLIVARLPVPVNRWCVLPFSGGGYDSAYKFIVRAVAGDHILDPVVKRVRRLICSGQPRVAQDRSPPHREVRGVVG